MSIPLICALGMMFLFMSTGYIVNDEWQIIPVSIAIGIVAYFVTAGVISVCG